MVCDLVKEFRDPIPFLGILSESQKFINASGKPSL